MVPENSKIDYCTCLVNFDTIRLNPEEGGSAMSPTVWYIPSKRTEPGKNVGIYCRVSSGEKKQLYSLSAQISALTKAVANVDQW